MAYEVPKEYSAVNSCTRLVIKKWVCFSDHRPNPSYEHETPHTCWKGQCGGEKEFGRCMECMRDNILVLVLDKANWWKLDLLLLNKEELFWDLLAAVS